MDDKRKEIVKELADKDPELAIQFARNIPDESQSHPAGFFQGSGGRKFVLTNICILLMLVTMILNSYLNIGVDNNTLITAVLGALGIYNGANTVQKFKKKD